MAIFQKLGTGSVVSTKEHDRCKMTDAKIQLAILTFGGLSTI